MVNRQGEVISHTESGPSLEVGEGLLASEGARALIVLLPALVAGVPLLIRRRPAGFRIAAGMAAVFVGGMVALGAMTMGLLFLPTFAGLLVAATFPEPATRPAT